MGGRGWGLSRDKYIPRCAGCGSVESGHELSTLCECRYSTDRVKMEGGRS